MRAEQRVLFLARSYPNNVIDTLGMWTAWLARELARTGEVQVVSPVPYCPPLPRLDALTQYTRFRQVERHEVRNGVHVYHPRFAVGPAQMTASLEHRTYLRAVEKPVREIREEFPFDLIHAHFIYPDGVVASRLAERYDVPFVVTDQAPWKPWLERRSIRRPALSAALEAARLACVSEMLKETMRHYLGPDARVDVIPNGVDDEMFRPVDDEGERNPGQIAYVGLINYNKGFDTLLEAMPRVVARNDRAKLVVVGGSYYRNTRLQEQALRRRAGTPGLDGHIVFVGRRPPEEVARIMRESAVVVLPSRAETFGAVLVEALASGTPVVSTASGGPEEIVTEDVGRLVPIGRPDALADALLDVLESREQFSAQRLRQYALERYRWSTIAEQYRRIYAEVLADHARRN